MSKILNESSTAPTTVHPELLRKWRQMFVFVTGDYDGVTSLEAWDIICKGIMTNVNIPAVKGEKIANVFQQTWKRMFADQKSLTMKEFIAHKVQHHLFNVGTLALMNLSFYSQMFHHIDFNDDGEIDFTEFVIFSKACGFKDEATIKNAFIAIDVDGNGTISKDEYMEAQMKYDLDAAVKMEDLPLYGLP